MKSTTKQLMAIAIKEARELPFRETRYVIQDVTQSPLLAELYIVREYTNGLFTVGERLGPIKLGIKAFLNRKECNDYLRRQGVVI